MAIAAVVNFFQQSVWSVVACPEPCTCKQLLNHACLPAVSCPCDVPTAGPAHQQVSTVNTPSMLHAPQHRPTRHVFSLKADYTAQGSRPCTRRSSPTVMQRVPVQTGGLFEEAGVCLQPHGGRATTSVAAVCLAGQSGTLTQHGGWSQHRMLQQVRECA
jgi:hypothetical protein